MLGFPHSVLVQLRSWQPIFSKTMEGFCTAGLTVALFRVHSINNLFFSLCCMHEGGAATWQGVQGPHLCPFSDRCMVSMMLAFLLCYFEV